MKFDVIIATYNRKESLNTLVNQILCCSKLPENIIIVDSSEMIDQDIKSLSLVKYIKSTHKNQPYQRYIGYLLSNSEILVYLDDDMRVIDKECFDKILELYCNEKIVGVQPNFLYEHNFFDHKMPKSKTRELAKKNMIFKFLKILSGNFEQTDGKLWLAGIRGNKPKNKKRIEWFNGPIFSVKKSFIYLNFNFSLFRLYERKIGKAEDAILGFTVSQSGDIVYLDQKLFSHDDQDDSMYSLNYFYHALRVAHSRLYLSLEYSRLTKTSMILAVLHFNIFVIGRIISLTLNQFIDYKSDRNKILFGYIGGYLKAIFEIKKLSFFENEFYWKAEAKKEIKTNSKLIKKTKGAIR